MYKKDRLAYEVKMESTRANTAAWGYDFEVQQAATMRVWCSAKGQPQPRNDNKFCGCCDNRPWTYILEDGTVMLCDACMKNYDAQVKPGI
jgi:hypothetical protein